MITSPLHFDGNREGGFNGYLNNRDISAEIPQHEIEALVRCLLPAIQKFFESEEGQREFEEWKKQQAEKVEK